METSINIHLNKYGLLMAIYFHRRLLPYLIVIWGVSKSEAHGSISHSNAAILVGFAEDANSVLFCQFNRQVTEAIRCWLSVGLAIPWQDFPTLVVVSVPLPKPHECTIMDTSMLLNSVEGVKTKVYVGYQTDAPETITIIVALGPQYGLFWLCVVWKVICKLNLQ